MYGVEKAHKCSHHSLMLLNVSVSIDRGRLYADAEHCWLVFCQKRNIDAQKEICCKQWLSWRGGFSELLTENQNDFINHSMMLITAFHELMSFWLSRVSDTHSQWKPNNYCSWLLPYNVSIRLARIAHGDHLAVFQTPPLTECTLQGIVWMDLYFISVYMSR